MIKAFVVGTGRSGTTLLANLLGSHSRLSPLYEPEFIVELIRQVQKQGEIAPRDLLGRLYDWGSMWGGLPFRGLWAREYDPVKPRFGSKHILFDKRELLGAATEFLDDLRAGEFEPALFRFLEDLAACHCRRDAKPHCVIKLPGLLQVAEVVLQAFPAARLVHIFRDGRDVWCSVRQFWWGPKTVLEAAHWWKQHLQVADYVERLFPERITQVRYESLIEQPDRHLAAIQAFLGVEGEPIEMPGGPCHLGRYRQEMTPAEQATFEREAGEALERKGYLVRV